MNFNVLHYPHHGLDYSNHGIFLSIASRVKTTEKRLYVRGSFPVHSWVAPPPIEIWVFSRVVYDLDTCDGST